MFAVFGLIVYNRATISIHQNFLKVVVYVIITEQRNQTARLYETQLAVI